jgi:hypothetical protein
LLLLVVKSKILWDFWGIQHSHHVLWQLVNWFNILNGDIQIAWWSHKENTIKAGN